MSTAEKCDDIHDEYFERRSIPRIRLTILAYFGAAIGTLSALGFFAISAQITSHSLASQETTVSRREFDATVARIERKLDMIGDNVNESLSSISTAVAENHQAIIRSQARQGR
jgi:hypothetical protein